MAGLLREIPGTEQLNALPSMAFGRHNALNVGSPNHDPTIEEMLLRRVVLAHRRSLLTLGSGFGDGHRGCRSFLGEANHAGLRDQQ